MGFIGEFNNPIAQFKAFDNLFLKLVAPLKKGLEARFWRSYTL